MVSVIFLKLCCNTILLIFYNKIMITNLSPLIHINKFPFRHYDNLKKKITKQEKNL